MMHSAARFVDMVQCAMLQPASPASRLTLIDIVVRPVQ
jgi:hypothetical protein